MKNKTIASWLIASFAVLTLGALAGDDEFLYAVGGVMMWVFGVWAIVKLYKIKD